jgi:hypothetical protein
MTAVKAVRRPRRTLAAPAPAAAPREADLAAAWEAQSFARGALRLRDGSSVRVIYRGRPGLGPGPDFRDAIIALPGRITQGDVELHVRASDFQRHGHQGDAAYCGVVLHVVLFDDSTEETLLADGCRAPVAALGGLRAARPPFAEPCRGAVARTGAGGVAAVLDHLGAMRFRQKAAAWQKRLAAQEPPEQALWSGLLEALGYGGSRAEMAAVAGAVPWAEVAAAQGQGEDVASLLRRAWLLSQPSVLLRAGMRPGNRPERRLEGAAALADRFTAAGGIAPALLGALDGPDPAGHLAAALSVPRLVGRGRALEIAANVVLPLAAALSPGAAARYGELAAALPLAARYGTVRHLHQAAAGIQVTSGRQQGMLYLLRQYCSQGGCGKCPLSEATEQGHRGKNN